MTTQTTTPTGTRAAIPATNTVRHHTTNDTTTTCGIKISPTTMVEWNTSEEVTCKRCLARLAPSAPSAPRSATAGIDERRAEKNAAIDGPIGPIGPAPRVKAPAKPKTIHMTSPDTPTGTLCNIAGSATCLAAEVTCRVCLMKINGTTPTNAIPDSVKLARKAFRSFVARATYMAYLDLDCPGNWTVTHTNMAGDHYVITSPDINHPWPNAIAATSKQHILDQIEALGWSCGEDR